MSEAFPVAFGAAAELAVEPIFRPDGSLDEAVLGAQFGLGVAEAEQQVTFGAYSGTVAQMLSDPRCPVGGMVRDAYQEHGIEGVGEKLKALGGVDPRFAVTISEDTRQREALKKKLIH